MACTPTPSLDFGEFDPRGTKKNERKRFTSPIGLGSHSYPIRAFSELFWSFVMQACQFFGFDVSLCLVWVALVWLVSFMDSLVIILPWTSEENMTHIRLNDITFNLVLIMTSKG